MRSGTSGLLFTQHDDGSIRVEVVDYDVEEFGGDGCDWEHWYNINKENADKLYNELLKIHSGTFEEMLIAEFSETLDIPKFVKFLREHDIKYSDMTWTS